jgi:endoglucanase
MPDPIRFTSDSERSARDRRRREHARDRTRRRRLLALGGFAVAVVVIVIAAIGLFGSSPGSPVNPPASANVPTAAHDQSGKHHSGSGHAATSSPYGSCKDPATTGALHVTGNKLLDSANKVFVPYGVTAFGGMEYGGGDAWKVYQPQVIAQIDAAHKYWHANTIRLQMSEVNLFNNGVVSDGINKQVLQKLCEQVQLVRKDGMQAVISDQTEWPNWTERLPTARTVAFWKVIASIYRNQPGVSFDLYNEPRIFTASSVKGAGPESKDWIWHIWLHGGEAAGEHYVGMQALFNDVRNSGAQNVTWVEGPYFDNTLGLAGQYAVHGTNMVWDVHHPGLTDSTAWDGNFGYLTKKYPVVDGEWGQYSSNRPECRPASYTVVPQYLAYLRAHNVGVIGWSLQPGAMLADPTHAMPKNFSVPGQTTNPAELASPNQLTSSYACTNDDVGQGIGQLLMNEFKQYSTPAS